MIQSAFQKQNTLRYFFLGAACILLSHSSLNAAFWRAKWAAEEVVAPDRVEQHRAVCRTIERRLQSQFPELRNVNLLYVCDFSYVRDTMVGWNMWIFHNTSNISVALALSTAIGYGCSLAGEHGVSSFKLFSDMTQKHVAASTALGSAVIDKALSVFGCDVANYSCWKFDVPSYDQLLTQAHRLTSDFGMSDHFLFAYVRMGGDTFDIALGGPMQIHMWDRNLTALSPSIPLIRLSINGIDFRKIGANIKELDYTESRYLPGTLQCVLAFEKINNQWLYLDMGKKKKYSHIGLKSSDKDIWREPRESLTLTPHAKYGAGGLREVHLTSPINRGTLFNKGHDDFFFAVVLNQDTVEVVDKPKKHLNVGQEAHITLHINGLYDNASKTDKVVSIADETHVYRWKDIMDEIFSGVRLTGAGIRKIRVDHGEDGTRISFTPLSTGKINLMIDTIDRGQIIWPVAVVGYSIEGDWELKAGGRSSVIRVSCGEESCQGELIVDALQHFAKGDIMWRELRPFRENLYEGREVRTDGAEAGIVIWINEYNQNVLRLQKDGTTHLLQRVHGAY